MKDIELSGCYQSVNDTVDGDTPDVSTEEVKEFTFGPTLSQNHLSDALKYVRYFGRTVLYGAVAYLAVLGLVGIFTTPDYDPSVENSIVWPATGAILGSTYCKTTCYDPCSTYSSPYGPLCCDWSLSSDGSKYCAQSIAGDGSCQCGSSVTPASKSDVIPAGKPTPSPSGQVKSDMHPWPTMAWLPFDDDKGSKPSSGGSSMNPPDDATPCKKHCDNECGTSNGLCCDYSASGNCDIYSSQKNGKSVCLCGTK